MNITKYLLKLYAIWQIKMILCLKGGKKLMKKMHQSWFNYPYTGETQVSIFYDETEILLHTK